MSNSDSALAIAAWQAAATETPQALTINDITLCSGEITAGTVTVCSTVNLYDNGWTLNNDGSASFGFGTFNILNNGSIGEDVTCCGQIFALGTINANGGITTCGTVDIFGSNDIYFDGTPHFGQALNCCAGILFSNGTDGMGVDSNGNVKANTVQIVTPNGFVSSEGSNGGTATVNGIEFQDGLYINGTLSNTVTPLSALANIIGNVSGNLTIFSETQLNSNQMNINDTVKGVLGGTFVGSATASRRIALGLSGLNFTNIGYITTVFDTNFITTTGNCSWELDYNFIRRSASGINYVVSLKSPGASTPALVSAGSFTGVNFVSGFYIVGLSQASGVGLASNDINCYLHSSQYIAHP